MTETLATTSQHFIIGTAGHVDHGKTALIRALTGAETDRLREEQERGMSIDLGFASFQLPSGRLAGVIDVPGHERFLKNMLAGAGGIDLVVLVIAADEGVMPQTREHLDILNILQTRKGVVAITKSDLVDEEWLELVKDDVAAALKGTFLDGAPMVPLSSMTGAGIDELVQTLDRLAGEVPTRTIVGPWRLPVDRAFTIGGFGTVVTGTLIAGVARVGDRVAVLPRGVESRIRGLQVHGASANVVEAGTRVAMNLAGVDLEGVERGDVCAPPGVYEPTLALDVRLDVLKHCSREVKNRTRVRVHLGAAEVLARLNLLDQESLQPGDSGLAQLRLESPTVCAKGDRYVLRFYSPMETIGGGSIIDPHPARHRRFHAGVLANLAVKEKGTPEELVAEAVERSGLRPAAPPAVAQSLGMPPEEVRSRIDRLVEERVLVPFDSAHVVHAHAVEAAEHGVLQALAAFHAANPLRVGMSREELRSRLSRQLEGRSFQWVLARLDGAGRIAASAARVKLADHEPQYTEQQRGIAATFEEALLADRFSPPSPDEFMASRGLSGRTAQEVWEALIDNGTVVRIAEGVFLHRQAIEEVITRVRAYLAEHGTMTASQFRDLIGSTRKYAVPLLEYLDAQKVTRRFGDQRELF
jgi:selenocysteine-specific elongation factor